MKSKISRLAAVVLFAALGSAQEATDTIVKKDGAIVRGVVVTQFSLQGLKATRGSDTVDMPAASVTDVRWGGAPDAFVQAMSAMQRNDFENAKQLFGDAATSGNRDVLKTEARFLQAKAAVLGAADSGAAATAAGAMRAWLGEFADNWRVPEAMLLLGRSLRLGNLNDDAAKVLADLDNRVIAEGWSQVWSARSKYELGLSLLEAGKGMEARSAFQAASGAADGALASPGPDTAELQALKINSRVGEGETLVREKAYDRAADFFRSLANTEDAGLVGAGKAGEGEALYLSAVGENKPEKFRAAHIALANAAVFGNSLESAAKANYYLGKLLLALGEAREGNDVHRRAEAYFQIVLRSYPGTRWAALAKAELNK